MTMPTELTPSQLVAAATEVLLANGYTGVPVADGEAAGRLFEDRYGIVALKAYDSFDELAGRWNEDQGWLVETMSEHLRRSEPKAWEGYLVLLTPQAILPDDRVRVTQLRYDTSRVRKLVATGEDLSTLRDVEETLLPLLPLNVDAPAESRAGVLERLPDLLAASDIDVGATRAVVGAFLANQSIVERLHEWRSQP